MGWSISSCCNATPLPIPDGLNPPLKSLPPCVGCSVGDDRRGPQSQLLLASDRSGFGNWTIWTSISAVDLNWIIAAVNLIACDIAKAVSTEDMTELATSWYTLAEGRIGDWFDGFLYSAGQQANEAVQDQLSALSFTSLAAIFGAGLVTSLSLCTLSVLPLTLGYLGSWRFNCILFRISYHISAARSWSLIFWKGIWTDRSRLTPGDSVVAAIMGLNLLEIIELQLPSFFNHFYPRAVAANFPSSVQAYLAGLTFALAASPCSRPVLATLLGYVAASKGSCNWRKPSLAASFAGALPVFRHFPSLLSFFKFSAGINPVSGALLLGGGVYTFFDRLFAPNTMAM